jgi:hypothetical protein
MKVLDHVRALWGRWWLLPALLPLGYVAIIYAVGDLRPEHVIIPGLAIVLAYASARTKGFFIDVIPYLLVAVGYDTVRYARRLLVTPERVLGCSLRDAELAVFPAGAGRTFQDLAVAHHTVAWDLFFAVPYAIFAYVAFIYAGYLYFVDRPRMRHYLWAFALANFISFACWLIVPAAPPWYIREHGCAIDMSASPSAAGLLRVDEYLGVTYFATFYSRAASVYGALPSMHCAYPLLGLLTAWKSIGWKTKPLHIAYAIMMFTAAVYLDHHWIIDAVAGWLVAVVAVWLAKRLLMRFGLWGAGPQPASSRDSVPPSLLEPIN